MPTATFRNLNEAQATVNRPTYRVELGKTGPQGIQGVAGTAAFAESTLAAFPPADPTGDREVRWRTDGNKGPYIDNGTQWAHLTNEEVGAKRDFDLKGDGTLETAAVQNFFSSFVEGGYYKLPAGTYVVDDVSAISVGSFYLDARGAILKAADGMTVGSGTQLLTIESQDDWQIAGLKFDGNRANRTPAEVTSHLLDVKNCKNFMCDNVRWVNGTTDGAYFSSTTQLDSDTYCRDFTLFKCSGDNCYRNNVSIINGWDWQVIGGEYNNANGTAPEAGIDVESNPTSETPGNKAGSFLGVGCRGDAGYGLQVAASDSPYGFDVIGCHFEDCGLGGVLAGAEVTVLGGIFDNFTTSGAVAVRGHGVAGARVTVSGAKLKNFSAGTAGFDDSSVTTRMHIVDCELDGVPSFGALNSDDLLIENNTVRGATGKGIEATGSSDRPRILNNRVLGAVGRGIHSSATYPLIEGNYVKDVTSVVGAYIQAEGVGARINHNTCEASSPATSTLGIRTSDTAFEMTFNDCINLHSSDPYTFIGGSGFSTVLFAWNTGGTDNDQLKVRNAPFGNSVSSDYGDDGVALAVQSSPQTNRWNTPLTADRTVGLATGSAVNGHRFRVVRQSGATGAFNLNVGDPPLKALAVSQWCDVEYDGSAWILTAFGSL